MNKLFEELLEMTKTGKIRWFGRTTDNRELYDTYDHEHYDFELDVMYMSTRCVCIDKISHMWEEFRFSIFSKQMFDSRGLFNRQVIDRVCVAGSEHRLIGMQEAIKASNYVNLNQDTTNCPPYRSDEHCQEMWY